MWWSYVGCIYIYSCYIFLDWSFGHYVMSLSLSYNILYFKVYFDMSIATPPFFWFLFAWNIFFHPLTFNLCVYVKWVSWQQHIYGSCFCIHSASLCLLVGTFSSLTLKVIIDTYVLIAILLTVLDLFLLLFLLPFSCSLLLCFDVYIYTYKIVLSCWYLHCISSVLHLYSPLLMRFLVLVAYLGVDDFLPLLYACLYWWALPFVMLLFLVVAFSFPPREVPLVFVVKLV